VDQRGRVHSLLQAGRGAPPHPSLQLGIPLRAQQQPLNDPVVDLSFDEAAFSGRVPLFPLPGLVLLPGGLLPLHVFEPRYRAMTRDALDSERLIAMALLKPGYEADYAGNPAIEDCVCVGRITRSRQLPDGRWNMVLVGLRRARVRAEDHSRGYRLAEVELLTAQPMSSEAQVAGALRLAGCLADVPESVMRDAKRLAAVQQLLAGVPAQVPLGAAVDMAADTLHLRVLERLELLQAANADDRLRALIALVALRDAPRGVRQSPFSLN
jgi:Lon protease-like protein